MHLNNINTTLKLGGQVCNISSSLLARCKSYDQYVMMYVVNKLRLELMSNVGNEPAHYSRVFIKSPVNTIHNDWHMTLELLVPNHLDYANMTLPRLIDNNSISEVNGYEYIVSFMCHVFGFKPESLSGVPIEIIRVNEYDPDCTVFHFDVWDARYTVRIYDTDRISSRYIDDPNFFKFKDYRGYGIRDDLDLFYTELQECLKYCKK